MSAASRGAARTHFLEGNRLFEIPLFAKAAEQYTAALALWKHPAFYFNLALAQLNVGQDTEAHGNLRQAIRFGEEPLGPEQFQEARKQLQELERTLGWLRVTCTTQGAEVALDGVTLFTGPGRHEGWIKATAHEITARRPSYLPRAVRVALGPGQRKTLDIPLRKLSEAEETRWAVWKPWAVVASGSAIGLTAGGLHLLAARNFAAYDDAFLKLPCAAAGCSDDQIAPEMKAQHRRAELQQKLAAAGYVTGGAVIAAGVTLLYINRPRLVEPEARTAPSAGVIVVPSFDADTLGIVVSLSH